MDSRSVFNVPEVKMKGILMVGFILLHFEN